MSNHKAVVSNIYPDKTKRDWFKVVYTAEDNSDVPNTVTINGTTSFHGKSIEVRQNYGGESISLGGVKYDDPTFVLSNDEVEMLIIRLLAASDNENMQEVATLFAKTSGFWNSDHAMRIYEFLAEMSRQDHEEAEKHRVVELSVEELMEGVEEITATPPQLAEGGGSYPTIGSPSAPISHPIYGYDDAETHRTKEHRIGHPSLAITQMDVDLNKYKLLLEQSCFRPDKQDDAYEMFKQAELSGNIKTIETYRGMYAAEMNQLMKSTKGYEKHIPVPYTTTILPESN